MVWLFCCKGRQGWSEAAEWGAARGWAGGGSLCLTGCLHAPAAACSCTAAQVGGLAANCAAPQPPPPAQGRAPAAGAAGGGGGGARGGSQGVGPRQGPQRGGALRWAGLCMLCCAVLCTVTLVALPLGAGRRGLAAADTRLPHRAAASPRRPCFPPPHTLKATQFTQLHSLPPAPLLRRATPSRRSLCRACRTT